MTQTMTHAHVRVMHHLDNAIFEALRCRNDDRLPEPRRNLIRAIAAKESFEKRMINQRRAYRNERGVLIAN